MRKGILFLVILLSVLTFSLFPRQKTRKELKKEITVTIASVGDIFIHKSVLNAFFEKKTYNFSPAFSEISPYLKEVDLATAWFGGALDTIGPYTGYPLFKTPEDLARTMREAGFSLLFRTNHTLDYGEKGLRKTAEILKGYGISQVGAYTSEEESKEIFIFEKGSLKIAFLSYTYGTNGIPIPKPWMVNLIDTLKIKEDIKKAKEKSDFVIVALHFGIEYQRRPNQEQKRIVRFVAESGADLIIGSHPHVIQPVELLNLPNGRKVYCAYSLGNFFCGQRMRFTDTGIILRYKIIKEKDKTELKEINYLPVWIAKYEEDGKYRFKILPLKKALKLYEEGKLEYLKTKEYKRMKEAYEETVRHINNLEIGFQEFE
ncbi:MAG: CapA family protein [candidate division WOR-3 bacterium]